MKYDATIRFRVQREVKTWLKRMAVQMGNGSTISDAARAVLDKAFSARHK